MTTRNTFLAVVFILLTASAALAQSLTLEQAKNDGLVGERLTGYLGSVHPSPTAEVASLIKDINNRRQLKYQEIAKSTAASLSSVEKLAATQAIEKSAPGHFIEVENGKWVQR